MEKQYEFIIKPKSINKPNRQGTFGCYKKIISESWLKHVIEILNHDETIARYFCKEVLK